MIQPETQQGKRDFTGRILTLRIAYFSPYAFAEIRVPCCELLA